MLEVVDSSDALGVAAVDGSGKFGEVHCDGTLGFEVLDGGAHLVLQ